ncbi:helix-hairpin-helix domain-containing protein [Fodinibius halophilus]|uniref:Helix-hairpin-helix domain-containing protein n=1 Tax=Fodinibius halophilus TaxID=1736908 RepID=A0A6M1TC42_9BACT|nr:helix-hairpin-helix domain-containing protein [Fodinibius halophilus]NGP87802.1 helix-hairpin-helix domain-containing protein [Fodinibius halophilus]
MQQRFYFIVVLLFLGPLVVQGQQQDSTQSEVQDDLEEALEVFDPQSSGADAEQLTQLLQELAANPVNINSAGINALLQVPGLNLKTARAIIDYRTSVKPFETVNELDEVSGIGRVTLEKMRPYVTPGRGIELSKALFTDYRYWTTDGRFQAFSRYQQDIQKAEGYNKHPDDGGYVGNRIKYYQRFGYQSDHISLNLTQEKDPGEQLVGPTKFDHRSWHVALEDNGKLQMLVGGDYSLAFGQGLVLWSGAAFGKGSDVIGAVSRNGRGIKPYTSAQETNFYRGGAVTYGGKLQLTGFYSNRRRSASVISDDTTRFPGTDGYKRTANEFRQEDNLGHKLYGGHIQMEFPFGIVGATGYKTTFDHVIAASDRAYAQYDFEGRENSAFGVDYTLLLGPAVVFGEAARTENGGLGFITGVESGIGEDTEMTLAYRHYQKNFQSILGNGFGEVSGQPKNEQGVYLGIQHTIGDKVTLFGYFDQFRFPSARFGTNQPTQGYDWLGKAEVEVSSNLNFYLQFRSEIEDDEYEVTDRFGRKQQRLGSSRRSTYRAHLEYQVNPKVRLRSRGELVQSKQAGEELELGYLIYQDIRFQLRDNLQLDARLSMFDTESFDTRVYQFENDLLYVFASQALFDKGQRMYALLNYEPFDFLELWAKFGITVYEDKQVIGSGLNQVEGDTRSEVGIQARLKF